jgi:hypothetical protein
MIDPAQVLSLLIKLGLAVMVALEILRADSC